MLGPNNEQRTTVPESLGGSLEEGNQLLFRCSNQRSLLLSLRRGPSGYERDHYIVPYAPFPHSQTISSYLIIIHTGGEQHARNTTAASSGQKFLPRTTTICPTYSSCRVILKREKQTRSQSSHTPNPRLSLCPAPACALPALPALCLQLVIGDPSDTVAD